VLVVEHAFLKSKYAMKLLHGHLIDRDDLQTRLLLEAQTLANIDHPNIVRVQDGGVTTETPPRPYFVMELLRGQTLSQLLAEYRRTGLGFKSSLMLVADLLDGLKVAHTRGVVHRDLKPANIFLHKNPSGRYQPKILDFGIQHLIRGRRMTGEQILGTLRYSAPEQIQGERPTPQTDLYSLGVVFYEMVCGRGPFDECKKEMQLAEAHLRREPPPLSTFVQNVPEEVERLMTSWLAKDARKRPPTAELLALKLREIRGAMESGKACGSASDTEPDPLRPFSDNASGERDPQAVTSPAGPEAKKSSTVGEDTQRDAAPMGVARTLEMPVDRVVRTPTMHVPERPRQATDTLESPSLGHLPLEESHHHEPANTDAKVRTPTPAAGRPADPDASKSASGIAASIERAAAPRRLDPVVLSLVGLAMIGTLVTMAALWAVSRPRSHMAAAVAPAPTTAPTTTAAPAVAIEPLTIAPLEIETTNIPTLATSAAPPVVEPKPKPRQTSPPQRGREGEELKTTFR